MAERVYWGTVKFKKCILYLVATDLGLALVTWPDESFEAVEDFVQNRLPGRVLTRDPLKVKAYKGALHQYLEYGRALIEIPAGQTRTYSDIAQRIGRQDAVRAVAHAIGVNPIPFLIPCHRVIGKDGNLTGYRGGLLLKESLLQSEGFLPKEPEYYL